jgi:hypothetical protein
MKSKKTAYILWFFLGLLGAHKFYLDKFGMGILYMLTCGLFFIGWIVDLFTLGKQVDQHNKSPPKPIEWVKPVKKIPENYDKKTNNGKTAYIEAESKLQELKKRKEKATQFAGETVYIEYEDANGNYTNRTIEIKKVSEKNGEFYIRAYCFMQGEERTFRADRIITMKKDRKGKEIKDIKGFLISLTQEEKTAPSLADLASLALEDPK